MGGLSESNQARGIIGLAASEGLTSGMRSFSIAFRQFRCGGDGGLVA